MNNVKKLLAVLIVVTMLVTAMIPVMAADTFSYEDEATVLADLGLMIGDGEDMDLDSELTREMGAVLLVRLLGAEEDALALTDAEITAALKDYTDNDDISFWAEAYVAYATEAGYLTGRDDGSLDPKANLLGKDYCTMILRAMGYEVDAADWAIAASLLVEVDGLSTAEAIKFNDKALIRDAAAGITYAALSGEVADGGSLIAALVAAGAVDADDAVASGLYTKPAVADVKDATISNLREVVVTFTAPVNATEAAKVANYTIATVAPSAVAVAADNKSVTLTAASSFTNYSSYAVVVKAAVGIPADVTKTVKAVDITVPTLTAATATGPKSIKLTFSEPLNAVTAANVAAAIKLDNSTIAIYAADVVAGSKTIVINTYVNLAEAAHTVAISGSYITDLAGYAVQPTSIVFDYVKDTSPLSFTVGATTETSVKIIFNKAIAANSFVGNANVYVTHTYNTDTNKLFGNSVLPVGAVTTSDNLTFTVTFGKPVPPGTATVYVGYVSSTNQKIVDGYGNAIEAFNFPVTTSPDVVKPTATAAFTDATHIAVTFSEAVDNDSAILSTNYVLKDSAGAAIAVNTATFTAGSTTVINLVTAQMNGGSYTLEIKNVKDRSVAQNVIDTVVLPFTGTDKVPPTMGVITRIATDKVKIAFSEAMDITTISNKLAYKYSVGAGAYTALAATDTVTAAADGKSVVIDFDMTATVHPEMAENVIVSVAAMKDLAGNWIDGYMQTYAINDLTKIDGLAAITGKNTIKLTINDIVTGMTVNDFVYSVDSATYYKANSIAVEYDATKTYVTLYTGDMVTTSTTGAGVSVATYNVADGFGGSVANIVNAYANTVQFTVNAPNVADKYAPAIASVSKTVQLISEVNKITQVKVVFTEQMYAPSIQDADFVVSGTTIIGITSVTTNGAGRTEVVIDVTDVTDAATTVTLVGPVEDSARNILASAAAVTATNP